MTSYKVEDWQEGKEPLGGNKGSYQKIVEDGYSIMGFWRGDGEYLKDLKYVLAGKGVLTHLPGLKKSPPFYFDVKDKNELKTCKSIGNTLFLKGFLVWQRDTKGTYRHLTNGICNPVEDQIDKAGRKFNDHDCYTQNVNWESNTWIKCDRLGYYIVGLTTDPTTKYKFSEWKKIDCCRPKLLPIDNTPV